MTEVRRTQVLSSGQEVEVVWDASDRTFECLNAVTFRHVFVPAWDKDTCVKALCSPFCAHIQVWRV